jgi:2,4-dienoyl-CoA reductase-like NADH-dependent reductase (Old Yellow Enzyme family)
MTSSDPLLQPFRLKHLTLRNRFMSTAHEPAYTEDGMPKERYRRYHAEKAKGGIALTVIGGSAVVSPDSPQAFGNILLYKDEVVPWLRELADEVHAHGAAVMIQLTHLGRRTSWSKGDWLPVVAPSPVREPAHRAFPKAVEEWDIARILRHYADAAERCKAGGLDGIEVECYGHLADQFWSPATNRRDDLYGGSLDNRMRFSLEALAAIRDRVGPDFIVGVRMVCDEDWEKGLSKADGMAIAQRLAASGRIDFINVIRGHIDTDEALSHVIPGMGAASAPHLDFAGEVRAATRFPVFHAARIQDVATARHAVATSKLDMVGMTRAHIADPHIARKVAERREEDIRPCVGMGYCIDRIYFGGEALCAHNAATGREATMPHVVARSAGPQRKVVVIGAGPAGLEAARVTAERGHEVVVLEAAAEAGGQIRLAANLARRREIIGIVEWRLAQCAKHGVRFRYNLYAETADIVAERPDIVVVATGGLPNLSFLAAGAELVTTSWDILSGAAKPAESVLLFDDNGADAGMTVGEFIAVSGSRLEIATPERSLALEVGGTNYPAYFRAFAKAEVAITLNLRLEAVARSGNKLVATLFNEYDKSRHTRDVDQVVVEHGTLPLDELYVILKPGSSNLGEVDYDALIANRPQDVVRNPDGMYRLYRIGDAVSSRNIHAAVYDALRLAKDF